ncbi:putative sulfate exporter family transporter [Cohnella sp. CBP 2801]|uniref:Putative sulfate exporter family transporter n=2 Tax=Cohnella zeiphila TaxID=2761120 RepID=A0A7X0SN34_9BACL|nr:putative sulfate exporter family transporter [Cohnella zeiphila]
MNAQPFRLPAVLTAEGAARRKGLIGGLALIALLTLAGWQLSRVPGLALAGPMACTLLLAIVYRNLYGYPEELRPGIAFAGTRLLRTAIILFGLKLPIDVVLGQGLPYLARAAGTLAFALAASAALSRLFKADRELSLLLAIGTGICGAAAIAATAPLLGSKEQKTALSAGLIAATGTLFAVAYTLLEPVLPINGVTYGIWSGLSLHEIAHVALASAAGGPDALSQGMLAKLSRVLLLVPLTFALHVLNILRQRRHSRAHDGNALRSSAASADMSRRSGLRGLPWYLLGFVAMSLFASTHPDNWLPLPSGWESAAAQLTTTLLVMAMAAFGLSVNVRELRYALRPLAVLLTVSILLSAAVFVSLL